MDGDGTIVGPITAPVDGGCVLQPVRGPFHIGDRVYVPECQAWGTIESVELHGSPFDPYFVRFDEPYPGGIRARSYKPEELRPTDDPEADAAARQDLRRMAEELRYELAQSQGLRDRYREDTDYWEKEAESRWKLYVDADNRAYRAEQALAAARRRPWWRFW